MVDGAEEGAEAETEEEHGHLRIREASARSLGQKVIKNIPFSRRGLRQGISQKDVHYGCPFEAMYCFSQSFYLWLPRQDSRLNGKFVRRAASIAADLTCWQSSQWGQAQIFVCSSI